MALTEQFIERWQNQHGGAERANYALFLAELAVQICEGNAFR